MAPGLARKAAGTRRWSEHRLLGKTLGAGSFWASMHGAELKQEQRAWRMWCRQQVCMVGSNETHMAQIEWAKGHACCGADEGTWMDVGRMPSRHADLVASRKQG